MPDTEENQKEWPQSKRSKPGCGFPLMRIVGVFSLATGALLDLATGPMSRSEGALFRSLWYLLRRGDVLLADRGFCSLTYLHLLSEMGIDCVMRKNARRINNHVIKRISKHDHIVAWRKSRICPAWLEQDMWDAMPEIMAVREVRVQIAYPGFRTQTIYVATTLLDDHLYPEEAIALLYLRRWRVEVFLRDIKTTMGMDILRCKTPNMVEIEVCMHVIAYNLIRAVMLEAGLTCEIPFERISCKGTISTLRQWAPVMVLCEGNPEIRSFLYARLLYTLAHDTLPLRPGRTEPRARKRRPKNYQLLMKPRHAFQECKHRNKYKKGLS